MTDFPDSYLSAYWQEPDFLLADLVSLLANRADSQLGITLIVKGAILTGVLVGEREYLTGVNDLFKRMARETMVKPSKADIAALNDDFNFDELTEDDYTDEAAEGAPEPNPSAEPPPIRHLHLKDPVIIYPGATLSFTESALPILRIRLAAVDGWMMGRISVIADGDDLPDVGFIQ